MRLLTSQLLLLEANMRVKQHKIDALLNQRDRTISQQQQRIDCLEKELLAARIQRRPDSLELARQSSAAARGNGNSSSSSSSSGCGGSSGVGDGSEGGSAGGGEAGNGSGGGGGGGGLLLLACHDGDDSLDDSDSAVIIEDGPDSHSPNYKEQDPRNPSVSSFGRVN